MTDVLIDNNTYLRAHFLTNTINLELNYVCNVCKCFGSNQRQNSSPTGLLFKLSVVNLQKY